MAKRKQVQKVVVGYEIEFYLPRTLTRITEVRRLLRRAVDVPVSNRDRTKGESDTHIFVRRDASLTDKIGYEIVTPPLPKGKANRLLAKVFKFIKNNGGYTNDETGLHVNMSLAGEANTLLTRDRVALVVVPFEEREAKRWGREENQYAEPLLHEICCTDYDDTFRLTPAQNYIQAAVRLKNVLRDIDNKHVTVNLMNYEGSEGYYEFRIIGDKDFHLKYKKIMQSVERYARLLTEAVNMSGKVYVRRYNELVKAVNAYRWKR